MFVVIHCMGMPFNGNTIKEKSLGGSETAAYYMAKELAALGHKVTIFTNSQERGVFDKVKYEYIGQVSEYAPLGNNFHTYAENTPHDVLIIQRHPHAFTFPFNAKTKLWWVHDLAQIRRQGEVQSQLWNVDGVLTVSEFHKKQICDIYGLNPDAVFAIQNGIDLSLFEGELENEEKLNADKPWKSIDDEKVNLLYTSRPERGLEHLVKPGGIMDRLQKEMPKAHLYVCGYENTVPQIADYYNLLWEACNVLPNVTNLGSLTKQELADVMRQCDALVYPTPGPKQPEFEEVSCITAMECMAAGLPFISSKAGALEETCEGSGAILLDLKDGLPDHDKIIKKIKWLFSEDKQSYVDKIKQKQLSAAPAFAWSVAASMVEDIIWQCIKKNRSMNAVLRSMIRNSDIYAATKFVEYMGMPHDEICDESIRELEELYGFAWNNTWGEHYAKYYQYEKDRGVEYGPEELKGNNRFEHVAGLVSCFPDGISILDYGCAHGHYTINLAKRFPDKTFIGVDIEPTNIEKARKWAQDEGLSNVTFYNGWVNDKGDIELPGRKGENEVLTLDKGYHQVDGIIAAEVVEHVGDPQHLVDSLCSYLKDDGVIILTTPYGPWEAIGATEHWPWRAHVHHFDRADIHDMFSHHKDFSVSIAPSGSTKWGEKIGSYVTTFGKPTEHSNPIDYPRKIEEYKPLQTISLCMILKDAEETLLRTLNTVKDVVDEMILAIDPTTTDGTRNVIDKFIADRKGFWPIVSVIDGLSALEVGFDEARNHSIKEASGDWILWMDADEILIHPDNIFKYLHNNQFDGYAVKQHHFAVQPLGVMKTDLPVRLFRNHKGIKFFGVVHEHPEKELNKGAGFSQLLPDVEIAHQGYTTEAVRRKRFDRNIGLMAKDREKYPDRMLGKFLWIRDLAQMCQYELEYNGGRVTTHMTERAVEGIRLWEELLEANQIRMLVDGLQFYSTLSQILGNAVQFGFTLDASKMNGGVQLEKQRPVIAHFAKREHIDKLFNALTNDKVKDYGSKYF